MDITLDQAQAFAAIARLGTVQSAAHELHKSHSAILYLIRTLETQTRLQIFDRSQYRNQITPAGEVVLQYCRQLLSTREEFQRACIKLSGGWEPSIRVIYDSVVDFNWIADALLKLSRTEFPTDVKVLASYIDEVGHEFAAGNADVILTIVPLPRAEAPSIPLDPIRMLLVASSRHELALRKGKLANEDLEQHTFIKVRDTSAQLGLSTERCNFKSMFRINDFPTKSQAIFRKLGFGWMPEYLIERHLKNGTFKVLNTEIENEFVFKPRLYHRKRELVGRATQHFIDHFAKKRN